MPQDSSGKPWHSTGEQLAAAVVLQAVTGGRSSQRPEVSDRKRCAKWRLFDLGAAGKAANLGGCKSLYRQLLDSDGEHIHCSGR